MVEKEARDARSKETSGEHEEFESVDEILDGLESMNSDG